jgi:hypothetical protein
VKRLRRFLGTPFGVAVLGCLVLAGWALWSGGVLDGPIAKQLRSSSVYAAPGVDLDQAAAERIIGNRRLVVAILEPGADLRDACHSVDPAAEGTVALMLSRDGDEFGKYGCALFPDRDDENFGKAFVAESMIGTGADQFADRPLDALKVVAVNYDRLVKAGTVPDGARTVSPSLPRFLIAAVAIATVLAGAAMIFLGSRRAGRLAANRRERRDSAGDARSALSAGAAVLAQRIIDLDRQYGRRRAGDERTKFDRKYRTLVSDYTELLSAIAVADARHDVVPDGLAERVEALNERARKLA